MLITDESCLPVWVVRVHDRLTGEDLQGIQAFVGRMHEAPTSFLLVDSRTARIPDATVRKALGEFAATKQDDGRGRTLAVSVLLRSGLLSGAVRAILWFVPGMEEGLTRVVPDVEASLMHFRERGPGLIDDAIADRLREVLKGTPSPAA